ncbi:MAG: type I methionyl aminopeptidase [Candidatus Sumerlaeota bacterium]|nr:type I methionyl aminopeptidase [Candidatus Sumerlaeota bacterium]
MNGPVYIKTAEQLRIMRRAGIMLWEVFNAIQHKIGPGVLDTDLDRMARRMIEKMGAIPAFLGYRGFPATICCSINEEVVHGIPSGRRFKEGDIVGIDIGLKWQGFNADSAYTYPIGKISAAAQRLLQVTQEALGIGIAEMQAGKFVGDISLAVQRYAEEKGYGVVHEYTGHGIGRDMHEAPECPNFLPIGRGKGTRLRPGMVIAVEPMINEGTADTRVLDDQWTVVTEDGGLSAHFEHTVAVTENGPEIMTRSE